MELDCYYDCYVPIQPYARELCSGWLQQENFHASELSTPPSSSNCHCFSPLLSPFSQTLSGTQRTWNEIPLIHYHSTYGLVLGRNSPFKVSLGPGKPQSRFLQGRISTYAISGLLFCSTFECVTGSFPSLLLSAPSCMTKPGGQTPDGHSLVVGCVSPWKKVHFQIHDPIERLALPSVFCC